MRLLRGPIKRPRRASLRAVDFFAGCGGLTQGLKDAGFNVAAAVEIDADAAGVYSANHPDVALFRRDIRSISADWLMRALNVVPGELDLVAGCPPCQGFSALTSRNGSRRVDDPRNDLIKEFLRFIRKMRPRTVMMENVPPLGREPVFAAFCHQLNRIGYEVTWTIFDVAAFGVPQRRKRLILLAAQSGSPVLARSSARMTVRDAISALPPAGESGDPIHDLPEHRSDKILRLIRQIPKDGGSRGSLPTHAQLSCHKRCAGFNDVYGRMAWDTVAPTITSGCSNPSKGRFLHPEEDRCITLREASLLQGFPTTYRFEASLGKEKLALMIGNALPPNFVRLHGKQLTKMLLPGTP